MIEGNNQYTINSVDLLSFCIDVIQKEVKEDDKLVKQILFVMFSAYSNNPLNLAINAPPGEGKSYILTKVGNLFPKEDILFISGMTEKALFHRKGKLVIKDENGICIPVEDKINELERQIEEKEFERKQTRNTDLKQGLTSQIKEFEKQKKDLPNNAIKLIDLRNKILVFLDTPPTGLLNAIMSLLSHDQYEVEYEFVDTHNGIKTRNNVLRGWPAVIFAQAIDSSHHPRWPEIERRFIITNPKMEKIKYKKAIELIGDKRGLPDFVYEEEIVSDQEKERAKEIIKHTRNEMIDLSGKVASGKNIVIIPFNDTIKESLPKEKASDMTFADRIFRLLNLIPLVKSSERPKIVIRKEGSITLKKYPLTLFEDLSEALFLMEYGEGLRPYVHEWFYNVFVKKYNEKSEPNSKKDSYGETITEDKRGITTADLVIKTVEKTGKPFTKKQILDTYVYPLINQGYIDSIRSKIDGREKIYYPIITTEKNKNLFEIDQSNNLSYKRKLIVENSTSFPSKEYIKSRIQAVLKYSEKDTLVNKIVDNNETDIILDELVDRYYDNANEYFSLKNDSNKDGSSLSIENTQIDNSFTKEYSELSNNDQNTSNNNLSKTDYFSKEKTFENDAASEYSENIKNEENLYSIKENDINYTKNTEKQSKKLFEEAKTNNFLYSNDVKDERYECYYCEKFSPTSDKLVYEKHVLNLHPGKRAYPFLSELKEMGIKPKEKSWEK
ncbi:MAG: hypothetical protein ACPKPY_04335 [Nitrososphaeraceae archaeon]